MNTTKDSKEGGLAPALPLHFQTSSFSYIFVVNLLKPLPIAT